MKNTKLKKIFSFLTNAILVFLIIVAFVVLFSMLPFRGNYKLFVVTSGSMEPAIATGSVVLVRPASDYGIGDIITYEAKGNVEKDKIVTHRIVDIQAYVEAENGFIVKGDANEMRDPYPVTKDEILGKYYFSVAGVGYVVGYAKTLPGIVVIIVLATIIIYEEARKIRGEIVNIKNNKKKPKRKVKNDKKT